MNESEKKNRQQGAVCAFACGCMAVVFRSYVANAVPADYLKNLWDIALSEIALVIKESGFNEDELDRVLAIARSMVLGDFQDDERDKVIHWLEHCGNLH